MRLYPWQPRRQRLHLGSDDRRVEDSISQKYEVPRTVPVGSSEEIAMRTGAVDQDDGGSPSAGRSRRRCASRGRDPLDMADMESAATITGLIKGICQDGEFLLALCSFEHSPTRKRGGQIWVAWWSHSRPCVEIIAKRKSISIQISKW